MLGKGIGSAYFAASMPGDHRPQVGLADPPEVAPGDLPCGVDEIDHRRAGDLEGVGDRELLALGVEFVEDDPHGVLVLPEEALDPVDERLAVHVHGEHVERAGGLVLVGDPLDDRHLLAAGLAEDRPEDQQVGPLGALVAEDEGLAVEVLHGEIGGRQPDLEGLDALDHRYRA